MLAALALAAPSSRLVVHENRAPSTPDISRRHRLDPNTIIPIHVALTQTDLDSGYDYLMDVADPLSPNYGKHWSIEEIHAKFAPSEHTIEAVKAWLEESGIERATTADSTSRGWLGVNMSVRDAEKLFGTAYYGHEDEDGKVRVGCDL